MDQFELERGEIDSMQATMFENMPLVLWTPPEVGGLGAGHGGHGGHAPNNTSNDDGLEFLEWAREALKVWLHEPQPEATPADEEGEDDFYGNSTM